MAWELFDLGNQWALGPDAKDLRKFYMSGACLERHVDERRYPVSESARERIVFLPDWHPGEARSQSADATAPARAAA